MSVVKRIEVVGLKGPETAEISVSTAWSRAVQDTGGPGKTAEDDTESDLGKWEISVMTLLDFNREECHFSLQGVNQGHCCHEYQA